MSCILCPDGKVQRSLILRADPRLLTPDVSTPASCFPLPPTKALFHPDHLIPNTVGGYSAQLSPVPLLPSSYPRAGCCSPHTSRFFPPRDVATKPLARSAMHRVRRDNYLLMTPWWDCTTHGRRCWPASSIFLFSLRPPCKTSELKKGSELQSEISPAKLQLHNIHSGWSRSHYNNKDG